MGELERAPVIVMFVYKNSSLHAAAHYVAQSIATYKEYVISNILVQESCYDEFIGILKTKLRPFPENFLQNPNFREPFKAVASTVKAMNAKVIYSDNDTNIIRPTVVCDLPLEHYDEKNSLLIPTLTAFRTTKDALNIASPLKSQKIVCNVWENGLAEAFEVVLNSPFQHHWLNCFSINLECIVRRSEPCILVENNYVYQRFKKDTKDGEDKFVVFPCGTTFAN